MGLQELIVDLESKVDDFGHKYFVGRFRAPVSLRFQGGVAFKVYLNEEGYEELRISCARPGSDCHGVKKRLKRGTNKIDRYVIRLNRLKSGADNGFYLGLVQEDQLELDLGNDSNGVVFFIFTSKPGAEELHIGRNEAKFKTKSYSDSHLDDEEFDWKASPMDSPESSLSDLDR